MTTASLHALLSHSIDYAGLFPPAALDLPTALRNYRRYQTVPDNWMLGSFALPAHQAEAFTTALAETGTRPSHVPVSLLVTPEDTLPAGLHIVSVEAKADEPAVVRQLVERWQPTMLFVELNPTDEREVMWATLRELGAGAKIRAGGIAPDAFPAFETVVSFIIRAADWRVPFKATAGLHHPIRAVHPLTDDAGSPRATMHGFLNVYLAAAFAWHGMAPDNVERVLAEEEAANFQFGESGVAWHCQSLTTEQIQTARREFCRSHGSCSFDEPRADLRALGLLS